MYLPYPSASLLPTLFAELTNTHSLDGSYTFGSGHTAVSPYRFRDVQPCVIEMVSLLAQHIFSKLILLRKKLPNRIKKALDKLIDAQILKRSSMTHKLSNLSIHHYLIHY